MSKIMMSSTILPNSQTPSKMPCDTILRLDIFQRGTQQVSRNSREGDKSRKGVERLKSRKWF
jgi:hypothetical protein